MIDLTVITIDLERINAALASFEHQSRWGDGANYIVVSSGTLSLIKSTVLSSLPCMAGTHLLTNSYRGMPILLDDSLDLGQIKIV